MQEFPLPLLNGLERQLVSCLQAIHRVPLDARGWNEWRIVEQEIKRALRCLSELRRMAGWLRMGTPLGLTGGEKPCVETAVRTLRKAPFSEADPRRVSSFRSRDR